LGFEFVSRSVVVAMMPDEEESPPVSDVLAAWQAVDLPSIQLALDEQAETIGSLS
jgi:hypothetical protein